MSGLNASNPEIKIERLEIALDPSVEVFKVTIGDGADSWEETLPSEENLRWFLRGVEAGALVLDEPFTSRPEIPRNAKLVNIQE